MKQIYKGQDGYTLAEAIVAIGILSTALLGTLVLAVQSINVTDIAQTKTQAEFLSEEGIELVRAMREDSLANFKQYDPGAPCTTSCQALTFGALVGQIPNEGDHIDVNIDAKGHVCQAQANCFPLHMDAADNRYTLRTSSSSLTRFKRTISLTRKRDTTPSGTPGNLYIEVISKVDFTIRGTAEASTYFITTHLYDWM